MNVVHLVQNKVWGGGERYVLDLCRALVARGHSARVITRRRPEVSEPFAREGLLAGTLPLGGVLDVVSPVVLAKHLDSLDGPTVVHVHNFKAATIALRARRLMRGDRDRVRVICTRHLVRPARTTRSAARLYAELDAIIFVSRLALDSFLSTAPAVDRGKLHVVPNAIAADPAAEPRRPDPARPVRLLYSGRIDPEKGLDTLIEALGRLDTATPWQLDICGTGRSAAVMPLIRLASALGIDSRIDWRGFVADMAPVRAEADIAVVPSRVAESSSLAALEAMSQGIAVVATDNGAQREAITHGADGLLVPPDEPDELAAALASLIDNPTLRADMSRSALDNYRRSHSYQSFITDTLEVYETNQNRHIAHSSRRD